MYDIILDNNTANTHDNHGNAHGNHGNATNDNDNEHANSTPGPPRP